MEVRRILRTEERKCPVGGQEPTREAGRAPREEHEQRAGSEGGRAESVKREGKTEKKRLWFKFSHSRAKTSTDMHK